MNGVKCKPKISNQGGLNKAQDAQKHEIIILHIIIMTQVKESYGANQNRVRDPFCRKTTLLGTARIF